MKIMEVRSSGITERYDFLSHDGFRVKAAHINRLEKHIICLSTQIGCVGRCKFCSAGDKPLIRNLSTMEMISIVEQITNRASITVVMPLLVSFMGTGEPMDNADEVVKVIRWSTKPTKFAISTSGFRLAEIAKLSASVKMQFTLVSVDHNVRRFLQPHVDSIDTLGFAAEHYEGPKEFNVPLIGDYNDDFTSMEAIAMFSRSLGNIPVKLNEYHAMNGFLVSHRAEECLGALKQLGIEAEYYETDGAVIQAACGQFEL